MVVVPVVVSSAQLGLLYSIRVGVKVKVGLGLGFALGLGLELGWRLGLGLAAHVAALHFPDGHLVYAWLEYRVRVRCRVN